MSAITNYYKDKTKTPPSRLVEGMAKLISARKKVVRPGPHLTLQTQADAVQSGLRKTGEGKQPLHRHLYVELCKLWQRSGNVFAHCFATLSWDLMCRSENTQQICRSHLGIRDDSLTVMFGKMKNDQGLLIFLRMMC